MVFWQQKTERPLLFCSVLQIVGAQQIRGPLSTFTTVSSELNFPENSSVGLKSR